MKTPDQIIKEIKHQQMIADDLKQQEKEFQSYMDRMTIINTLEWVLNIRKGGNNYEAHNN